MITSLDKENELETHWMERAFTCLDCFLHDRGGDLHDQPEISPVKSLVAGKEVTLTCTSPGRCAGYPPIITWTGVQGSSTDFQSNYTDGNRTYFSNFTFIAGQRDNQSPLTCTVTFQPSMVTTRKTVILHVEYPPSIKITIGEIVTNESIPFIVKKGESISMHCTVDSNPKAIIKWIMGGQEKNGTLNGNELTYELKNIGLSDAGIYFCSAWNVQGVANKGAEIIVQYPPRTPKIICSMAKSTNCIMEDSNVTYALEGSTLSLLCSAESSPAATVFWIKPDHHIIPPLSSGQLNLPNISLSEEGSYTCQANNTHGMSDASVIIKVTYKPKTLAGENSTCLQDKNNIECTCKIQSFPLAVLQWKIDEKLYTSSYNEKDLNISTVTLNAVTNSTLKVSLPSVLQIQCLASNNYGQLSLLLLSNTPSASNALAIGAACGVIFIVVLFIAGFLIIQYIRKKTLQPKSEDKKEFNTIDSNAIYSNTEYCNGAHTPQQPPTEDEGSVYMNSEDVQYVTINFSKMKAKTDAPETETEYAEIKRK
ncbi:sialic acid-binding Ig-like lectin 10 [Pseudophryne corroboree]|uniref:sialic acid-binding Ig-like lectin 10 n=1 Tax=Pseudophryne corroboree TaxID=495146 RepID=UPI00308217FA